MSKNIEDGIINSILALQNNPFIGKVSIELQTQSQFTTQLQQFYRV
jgi:hypothetical protein